MNLQKYAVCHHPFLRPYTKAVNSCTEFNTRLALCAEHGMRQPGATALAVQYECQQVDSQLCWWRWNVAGVSKMDLHGFINLCHIHSYALQQPFAVHNSCSHW